MPSPLTRRALLVTAAVGVTAACTSPSSPPEPPPRPTPDRWPGQQRLPASRAAWAGARPHWTPIRPWPARAQTLAFTAAHASALSETLLPSPTGIRVQPGEQPELGQPCQLERQARTPAALPPGTRAATARALAAALLDAAGAHRAASTSVSADLARLLASVAGSDSALAAKLTRATG